MKGLVFYIPKEIALAPAEGHAIVGRWWTIHPEKGLAFYAERRRSPFLEPHEQDEPSPQCNSDPKTALAIQTRLYPDCTTEFVHVVFLAHAIKEMRHLRKQEHDSAKARAEGRS